VRCPNCDAEMYEDEAEEPGHWICDECGYEERR